VEGEGRGERRERGRQGKGGEGKGRGGSNPLNYTLNDAPVYTLPKSGQV